MKRRLDKDEQFEFVDGIFTAPKSGLYEIGGGTIDLVKEFNRHEMKDLKTYLITSITNYDLAIQIVNAYTSEEAGKIALASGAWVGCEVMEIDVDTYGEVISSLNCEYGADYVKK